MTPHLDPVCGMPVSEVEGIRLDRDGTEPLWFCSEFCRQQFVRHPGAYAIARPHVAPQSVIWEARRVAYFSMEVALSNQIPTYAGGLGVLAGDTLRSCADLQVPVVGVSLVHRRGYFRQEIRDDWHIVFEVEVPQVHVPSYVKALHFWTDELYRICPSPLTHIFRLGLIPIAP